MANKKLGVLLILCIFSSSYVRCEDVEETDERDDDGTVENDEGSVRIEDSVLVLNSENFDDVIKKNPTVLVEFYAPWCGHCKSLTPKYSAAAQELAKHDPPVVLAKVDATVHSELAQRFEVKGYPTLQYFKNGKSYEYDGPRETAGIVEYMKIVADPKWEPEPDAVIKLTKDNFDEVVNSEQLMLVKFCAPQNGQCKQLAPIYGKAAKELKKENPAILLAEVDGTVETELVEKYDAEGFPGLKIFRNGKASHYNGEHTTDNDIVSYMKNQVGDGAKEVKNIKQLKELFVPDDISVIGFFQSDDDPKVTVYRDLSNAYRSDFKFGITFDEELRKTYKFQPNSVVVFAAERFYTKYEPKWYVLEIKDDTTVDDILTFIKNHRLPLVGHYEGARSARYDLKKPVCLIFYSVDFGFDHREATQFWRHKIADIANKFPEITFAVADDEENIKLLQEFGLDESGEEINVGLLSTDGKKYPMEPMDEYDSDDIVDFLKKYKKGKLRPYIKSQRPPKKQTGHVTVVVGETFEKIVKDTSKDVLIEMYAPWCGHCKQLEPKYEALAKKLKKESNLVIAKIDATANDLPEGYSPSGFPTIYFVPSNNKDAPITYDGSREVEEFEKFLRKHATVSFGKNQKEEL
uniref:Protein disulfide-isomerase n=1 Tax=Arion vulgaris TaxID=1028688 RepID=A0A0B7B682_9EUPU